MGKEVANSRGGSNSSRALNVSGEITSIVHIYIEDSSLALGFRMLSCAQEWIDSLSGALEWMDP
jgi:hypothetical protein